MSPFEIAPIPQVKKKISTRGRKPCKSQIITSSPYKTDLEQAIETRASKRATKQPSTSRGRGRGSKSLPSTTSRSTKKEEAKRRLKLAEETSSSEEDTGDISSGDSSEFEPPPAESAPASDDAGAFSAVLSFQRTQEQSSG